jgi:long-chain acyl-CoA synthetase
VPLRLVDNLHDDEAMNQSIANAVLAWAGRAPELPALLSTAQPTPVTFSELGKLVRYWANRIPPARRIAMAPTSTPEAMAAVFGAWAAGSSVVLMHRHLTRKQADDVIARSRPVLVVQSDMSVRLGPTDPVGTPPGELFVALTSGSSGIPKLFARDHVSWLATFKRSNDLINLPPGTRVAVPGAVDHSHFLYGAAHALAHGATVDMRGAPRTEWDQVSVAYLVPTIASDLVTAGHALASLHTVLSSGAPWSHSGRQDLSRLLPSDARIYDFYGAGELSFVSVSDGGGPTGSVGRPFAGVEVRITRADGTRAATNEKGSVEVRSDMTFSGYLNDEGRVIPPSSDWIGVGDQGFLDSEGVLHLSGRKSRMFTRGALNVEPEAVEQVLAGHPAVSVAVCVPREDQRWGAVPAAFVILSRPTEVLELHRWCSQRLDTAHRPAHISVVNTLPLTHRGKFNYPAIERMAQDLQLGTGRRVRGTRR